MKRRLTDNIVAVLVAHQSEEWTLAPLVGGSQKPNDLLALAFLAKLDALFHDIAGELVLGEDKNLRDDDGDHAGTIFLLAIFNDVLDHVIAKLIRNEAGGTGVELGQN